MADELAPIQDPSSGEPSGGSGDVATAALVAPKKAPTRPKPRQLPPYKVLLHNDDVNSFEHVILAIVELTPLTTESAFEKTLIAHHQGVALLLVTHKERAELYQEQFTSLKLTVTIEPDAV
jgi:ATP-dependent Clp protease adaptor protein ClpS